MGCSASTKTASESELDERVKQAMRRLAKEHEAQKRKRTTFDAIILKFPIIARAFGNIRAVFTRFDANGDGVIDRVELRSALAALGSECTDHDLQVVFEGSDMTRTGALNFKQFLLCLSLASILELLPASKSSNKAGGTSESKGEEESKGGSSLVSSSDDLSTALNHVSEAYVLFDADLSGTIDRGEVLEMIKEKNAGGQASSALQSESRWKEMDWDKDGQITFKEFVAAMYEWVGVDAE